MEHEIKRILIVQTAFIGDVILTLPLVQVVKDLFGSADIDMVVVPRATEICRNHPALEHLIVYDKRGEDRGLKGFTRVLRSVRARRYDLAIVPHRSLRSALLVTLARIPLRIGFRTLHGRALFTRSVARTGDLHEIERNLSLLRGIGIRDLPHELPKVYPSHEDQAKADSVLRTLRIGTTEHLLALAPGTVWNTKRWPQDRYAALAALMAASGFVVVVVGGPEDQQLCQGIASMAGSPRVHNLAGELTLLQSAEILRRCQLLVANDSAPVHLGVAVGTPVVAIFGATVPRFGFAPYGAHDTVVEVRGLSCRPCSAHGGDECPIKTFECMLTISPERVWGRVQEVLQRTQRTPSQGSPDQRTAS